jgi:hypothetical protein
MLPPCLEERLTLRQVALLLHVHIATVWRWCLKGVRGRILRTTRVGGRRFVLPADLAAFLAEDELPDSSLDRERRADLAGHLLDAKGIRGPPAGPA